MKFAVIAALSLIVSVVSAFHVVTPSVITACGPLTVEYDTTTGKPPFSLAFYSGSAYGEVLAAFTNVTGTSFTWDIVTIPAGTTVVITLSDSSGLGSVTPPITVSPGTTDTCLDNPTSIPTLPSITTTHLPESSYPSSSSEVYSSSESYPSSSESYPSSSESYPSSSESYPSSSEVYTSSEVYSTDLSSSLSSLSSVISSASSEISSLTESTPRPSSTGGLSTSGGAINAAGFFSIGVATVVMAAVLA